MAHLGLPPVARRHVQAAGHVEPGGVVPQVGAEGELAVRGGPGRSPAGLQGAAEQERPDASPLASGASVTDAASSRMQRREGDRERPAVRRTGSPPGPPRRAAVRSSGVTRPARPDPGPPARGPGPAGARRRHLAGRPERDLRARRRVRAGEHAQERQRRVQHLRLGLIRLPGGAGHVPAVHHQFVGDGDADRLGGRVLVGDPGHPGPGVWLGPGLGQRGEIGRDPFPPVRGQPGRVPRGRPVDVRAGDVLLRRGPEGQRQPAHMLDQVTEGVRRAGRGRPAPRRRPGRRGQPAAGFRA